MGSERPSKPTLQGMTVAPSNKMYQNTNVLKDQCTILDRELVEAQTIARENDTILRQQLESVKPDSLSFMPSAGPAEPTVRDMSAIERGKMHKDVDASKEKCSIAKPRADEEENDITLRQQFGSMKIDLTTSAVSTRPSEPTLLGIPAELRNSIYEHVSTDASRNRTILGWKFVKAHINTRKDHSTLRQQFESAAVAHPLSKTCRRFNREYPAIDTSNTAPAYELVVTNFDLEQIELFLQVIQVCDIKHKTVKFRFQVDRNIVQSAQALSDKLLAHRNDQKLRCTNDKFGDIYYAVLLRYRDVFGTLDPEKTPTRDQLKEAGRTMTGLMIRCGLGRAPAPLGRWLLRFLKLGQFNVMLSDAQRAG
ncbi:hypothetical protein Q7P37_003412 [Cladosporium fusiforme]